MSREEDETETAESVLSKLLAGRSLLGVFTPRRETTALLEELRRDPGTRAILRSQFFRCSNTARTRLLPGCSLRPSLVKMLLM